MEVLASNGVVVSLSSVEIGRSKAHIQMSYHFANPRMEEGMSIYSSSHEGVSEGQKGTWPRAESLRAGRAGSSGDGRKVRAPKVPGKGPAKVRAIQRVGTLSDGFDASEVPGAGSSVQVPG